VSSNLFGAEVASLLELLVLTAGVALSVSCTRELRS
jgi:hypothetical protein